MNHKAGGGAGYWGLAGLMYPYDATCGWAENTAAGCMCAGKGWLGCAPPARRGLVDEWCAGGGTPPVVNEGTWWDGGR